ncbi:MAG TPA: ABC transporter ATP-binding protein [Anaerolineaceae bacterium]|nr:ABC transporter ATP-binding protein [Anaerolineaceae bacterium]HNZ14250.1 ABC transporter ATP-binding protein [Anaerolineaceae bacterium]
MALLEATDLHKSFGETHALAGVNLTLAAGEIHGLAGPDGAGKTTLLRLLCGALRPDSGSVTVCGEPLAHRPEQARAHLGYLSQRFSLYEDLTVLENLRFFAELRGLPTARWLPRSEWALNFVGLAPFSGRLAGQLSGGMKQKLGLATALIAAPEILLLDEPTTGVDPVTRQDFWQLILQLVQTEHIGVLLSTPYMDEASRCHRVSFLRRGQLIASDTPAALRARLAGQVVELRGEPVGALLGLARADADVTSARRFGDALRLGVRPGTAAAVCVRLSQSIPAGGGALAAMAPAEPLLEDVFIYYATLEAQP